MGGPGVLEAVARIVELGGAPGQAAHVVALRADFERRTGTFAPEDAWFEERSRAFWLDAVTRSRFGQEVSENLEVDERRWLEPLERAHRGLFRADGRQLVDVWSGAIVTPNVVDEASRAELAASSGQLFDARVVGTDDPLVVAFLPGAVFHPRQATAAIDPVLAAARAAGLSVHETLDRLLLMERALRSLSRVKAVYAYRPEALSTALIGRPARRPEKKRPT
jgi:hypothetical protein